MKAGLAIDAWKLPIFERHLKRSGFAVESIAALMPEVLLLKIDTINPETLFEVLKAANNEAAAASPPTGTTLQ